MRRWIVVAALLCLALFVFVACGKSSNPTPTAAPTEVPGTTTRAPEPTQPEPTTFEPTQPEATTVAPTTPAPESVPVSFDVVPAQGSAAGRLPVLGQDIESGASAGKGTMVSLTATANVGYTFAGWYAGDTLVSANNPYAFIVGNDPVALTARFTPNTYALVYVTESSAKGSVSGTAASGTPVAYGASVTLTATAATGYSFDGWYKGSEKVSDANPYAFTQGAAAIALQARFTANTYALTYVTEDAAKGSVSGTAASGSQIAFGSSVTLTATAAAGYSVDGG